MNIESAFHSSFRRIAADVREVFEKIRDDARVAVEDTNHLDVQRQYADLAEHLRRDVHLHRQLLHDTLGNYLADDALQILAQYPAAVRNAYFAARQEWLRFATSTRHRDTPEFQDRRILVAAGTGLAVSTVVRLLALSEFPLLFAIGSGAAAGFVAYRAASKAARASLSEAVETSVRNAEAATLHELRGAAAAYEHAFEQFLRERAIEPVLT